MRENPSAKSEACTMLIHSRFAENPDKHTKRTPKHPKMVIYERIAGKYFHSSTK